MVQRGHRLAVMVLILVSLGACSKTDSGSTQRLAFVLDRADVLSLASEVAINDKLNQFTRQTRHQLKVVTVNSLDGRAIEAYSLSLARSLGIGRPGYNDGVMLLLAPHERKVRIEVGTGLETILTNARCAEIFRRDILPRFKAGDLPSGIAAGVDAIIATASRSSANDNHPAQRSVA